MHLNQHSRHALLPPPDRLCGGACGGSAGTDARSNQRTGCSRDADAGTQDRGEVGPSIGVTRCGPTSRGRKNPADARGARPA